jgi:hypothetical protein
MLEQRKELIGPASYLRLLALAGGAAHKPLGVTTHRNLLQDAGKECVWP